MKKPKSVGTKRKKEPVPAPTRRSARVKELPKVNYDDEDWEVQHFGKRRRLAAKSDSEGNASRLQRKSPRETVSINYGSPDANMDDEILTFASSARSGWCHLVLSMESVAWSSFTLPSWTSRLVHSSVHSAGQGLLNKGATIPRGTLIGPYTRTFVSMKDN